MGAYICKQPNGLYCCYSTSIDDVTDYNMTEEDFVKMCAQDNLDRAYAMYILEERLQPFDRIKDEYCPNNCSTPEEFFETLKEMGDPVDEELRQRILYRAEHWGEE